MIKDLGLSCLIPANLINIESGQSFLVQSVYADSLSPSVTFHEHQKATLNPSYTAAFFGIAEKPNNIRIGLQTTDNSPLDEVVIRFNSSGTKKYNAKFDAASLNEGNQVLVTRKGNDSLAIATHPATIMGDTTQLGLVSKTTGNFQLVFSQFDGIDSTKAIILRDKFLGTIQDIRTNPVYKFNVTADTASQGNMRFDVVFGASYNVKTITEPDVVNHLPLTVFPNPITSNSFNLQLGNGNIGTYTVRLVNTLGQTVYATTLNHSVISAVETVSLGKKLATGDYTIIATDALGTISKAQVLVK